MIKAKSEFFSPSNKANASENPPPKGPSYEKLARFASLPFIPEAINYPIVVANSEDDFKLPGSKGLSFKVTATQELQAKRRETSQLIKKELTVQQDRRRRQVLKIREAKNRIAEANIEHILKDKRSRAFAFEQQLKIVKERAYSADPKELKERDEDDVKESMKKYVGRPGSQQWLKTTSGGRLKVNFPNLQGNLADYSPEGTWDIFNGFIGVSSKNENIKFLEARAKTAQQNKPIDDMRFGQCFKLTPWEEKRTISNAFTYLKLRHEGCPSGPAMQFSSKIRCMTDSTQDLDGPAGFRMVQRRDNRNEGPNWKGWQLHQPEFITEERFKPFKRREKVDEYEAISEMYEKFEQNHVIERGMIMPEKVLPAASFYTGPEYTNMTEQELLQHLRDRRLGTSADVSVVIEEEAYIEDREVQQINKTPSKPVVTGKATPITSDQTLMRDSEVTSPVPVHTKTVVFYPEIDESFSSEEAEESKPPCVEDKIEDVVKVNFGTLMYRTLRPQTVKPSPSLPSFELHESETLPFLKNLPPVREVLPPNHPIISMSSPVTPQNEVISRVSPSREFKQSSKQELIEKQLAFERKIIKSTSIQNKLQADLLEKVRLKSAYTEKRIYTAQSKRKAYLNEEMTHATEELDRKKQKIQEIIATKKRNKEEHERQAAEKRTADKIKLQEIKLMKSRQIEAQRLKTITKLRDAEQKFEQKKDEEFKRRERMSRITDARIEIAKRART